MCGIAGFCDYSDRAAPEKILNNITDVLNKRGPDDYGRELFRTNNAIIGLGHRRLSIIELSALGHQPMWNLGKDIVIVYNGEIFNYKEIREILAKRGYSFKSNSDTEVILNSFDLWGLQCVNFFIGIFALAIYRKSDNKIFLCRDRMGVKPLYYYSNDNLFLFASEIKSFHQHSGFRKEINREALAGYIESGYICGSQSIFENVRKVDPGSWLIYDIANKSQKTEIYWDINTIPAKPGNNISKGSILEELKPLILSSFKYRLVSDVPVGLFLSGGIDSSLLSAVLASEKGDQITTMTIGFNEKGYDEAPFARKISKILGTNHIEEYCNVNDAYKLFQLLPEVYDEPFGDSSALPTMLLSQMAGKYRKVVLSADGGDELFAGYPSYQLTNRYFRYLFNLSLNSRKKLSGILRKLITGRYYSRNSSLLSVILNIAESNTINDLNRAINNPFSNYELNKLLNFNITNKSVSDLIDSSDDLVYSLKNFDLSHYLIDDILVKVDRAAMYSSIESREPFLDHRLVEFASTLPSNFHLSKFGQKLLLKELLSEYLPKDIYDRPKMGFEIPVKPWLKDKLKSYFDFYLSEKQINESGLINYSQVKIYKDLFKRDINIRGLSRKLWFLLVFQIWYEKWMK